jgi:hypothetical protein
MSRNVSLCSRLEPSSGALFGAEPCSYIRVTHGLLPERR